MFVEEIRLSITEQSNIVCIVLLFLIRITFFGYNICHSIEAQCTIVMDGAVRVKTLKPD